MRSQRGEQYSRAFYDLSALVLSFLHSPPMPISLPDHFPDSPMMRSCHLRWLIYISVGIHVTAAGYIGGDEASSAAQG
ncbi:hypothetical protein N665_0248s0021 [Sinapis alba]|nr:hypothetical protein N665_0248s0021 [Sinapis alba]